MTRMTEMTSVKKARKPSARHRMSSSGRAEGHASIAGALTSSSGRAVPRTRTVCEIARDSRMSISGASQASAGHRPAEHRQAGSVGGWTSAGEQDEHQQAGKMSISASGG